MTEEQQKEMDQPAPIPQAVQPAAKGRPSTQKIVLVVLAAVVLSVVFLLPNFVSETRFVKSEDKRTVVAEYSPTIVSPSTAAEKTKYRRDAQTLLAEIISTRDELIEQNVESWAEIDFRLALEKVDAGDQQYAIGEYKESIGIYEQVLNELKATSELGQQKLNKALTDGFEAIEALDIADAASSSELAVSIAPQDSKVQSLAARSVNLPELARLLQSGDEALASDQLAVARTAYEQAVQLDPVHQRASNSLSSTRKGITESAFQGHMSAGYAALDRNEFEQAKESFNQAGRVYQGHQAVKQALELVENRRDQVSVSQQISQAMELEAGEEWQQALSIYESILQQDSSLTEVKVKMIPAKVRSDLNQEMNDLFADPLKLSASSNHRRGRQTLEDARSIPNPGPKLSGQIEKLDGLLKQSLQAVNVVFQSDNLTNVTLFRVAELGLFEQTSLELKPGRYIVAGQRSGFRDVRVEFTITGEPLDGPIVVRCDSPI